VCGEVVYCFTFSEVVSSGIRVGCSQIRAKFWQGVRMSMALYPIAEIIMNGRLFPIAVRAPVASQNGSYISLEIQLNSKKTLMQLRCSDRLPFHSQSLQV